MSAESLVNLRTKLAQPKSIQKYKVEAEIRGEKGKGGERGEKGSREGRGRRGGEES